jgi:6,7-dimethyl-8-ribityllumazine synthase
MIKGITLLRMTSDPAAYDKLKSFFSGLGFEPGSGWEDEAGRGAPFLAPLGNLEFVEGVAPASSDVLIEVTSLDSVHALATAWIEATYGDRRGRISAVEETPWQSRSFTVEPVAGAPYTFWEWSDVLKGRAAALEGDLLAAGMKFAIVAARWNAVILARLLQGALDALLRSGAGRGDIQVVRVPGAWEIPAAARAIAEQMRIDAIITLGCLLRGETAHYEAIYNEVSRGIGQSQQETGIPHAFGVLTCETLEQALNRAGLKAGNKGFEAAAAAIEMVSLRRRLQAGAPAEPRP